MIDLLTPQVPTERQHPHFRELVSGRVDAQKRVLLSWADGFSDRDGKFAIEFQTTFNSCFWELYVYAALRTLGGAIDLSHGTPDFVYNHPLQDFAAEAVIASHADGYAAESSQLVDITPDNKGAMLEYASVRYANALDAKLRKYRKLYAALEHVKGKAFVICLAPFEQPGSHALGDRALRRVLYAYDLPVFHDDEESGERVVYGETLTPSAWKASGSPVAFGLFSDDRAREISAVVFSNTATFGKLAALCREALPTTLFSALRYNDHGLQPDFAVSNGERYRETLLDGLHVFRNPHAAFPLDPRIFPASEVAIHYGYDASIGTVRSDVPHGFLISRSVRTLGVRGQNFPLTERPTSSPDRLPTTETWPDETLRPIGGNMVMFDSNHLAHYAGWTALVARDAVDNDWGGQASRGTFRDLSSWLESAHRETESFVLTEFYPTKEEAYEAVKAEVARRNGSM